MLLYFCYSTKILDLIVVINFRNAITHQIARQNPNKNKPKNYHQHTHKQQHPQSLRYHHPQSEYNHHRPNSYFRHKTNNQSARNKEINYLTIPTLTKLALSKSFSMAFVLRQAKDLPNIYHIMMQHPSLVKIVLNYNECITPTSNYSTYTEQVKKFAKHLWNENRVLHIYFIPLCGMQMESMLPLARSIDGDTKMCLINDIYFYDPFGMSPKDNSTIQGNVQKYTFNGEEGKIETDGVGETYIRQVTEQSTTNVPNDDNNSTTTINTKSFNEILAIRKKLLNFNGMSLNVSFLPSTTTYVGAEQSLCVTNFSMLSLARRCQSSKSYLGIDIELLREFSRILNFIPNIVNPSDGKYYGFRVSCVLYAASTYFLISFFPLFFFFFRFLSRKLTIYFVVSVAI